MKLLICRLCSDVVKLHFSKTFCECGASWGRYTDDDGIQAEVHGEYAFILGLDNFSLERALNLHEYHYPEDNLSIAAWVMAEPSRNVEYHRDEDANIHK